MSKPFVFAFLALTAGFPGRGTMANIFHSTGNMPPRPFGGIAIDLEAVGNGDALGIIDLPGSFVGDILTLPEVLIANHTDQTRVQAVPAGPDDGSEDPN